MNSNKTSKKVPYARSYLSICLFAALAGCAVMPVPLTQEQKAATIELDRIAMYKDQAPLEGVLSLEEAMARAIKYNLDNRLKLMEEAISFGQLEMASFDMLPKLTLAAGYTSRNNYLVSDSIDVTSGAPLLSNATSQDKSHRNVDLSATWNVIDFGVGYFQAHQQADRALIMQERRRKTVQSLMQQVRQAYWQAVGAQQLETQVEPLLKEVQQALDDSERVQNEKLRPPLEVLNYQKSLIDLVRQLETIRDELSQAKPRLASLMNLPLGVTFQLKMPDNLAVPAMKISLADMEYKALMQRPDINEANLQERISVNEVKKAIARILPGLEFNVGPHYDSNSFLHNHDWSEGGMRVTWNLLNILSAPANIKVAKKQVEVSQVQRMALNMAVLTQVHLSYRDYTGRVRQYALAQKLYDIDRRINEQTKAGAANDAQSKLNAIRSGASEMMADYRRYQNYSALQASYAQMIATLGVDPLPEEVASHDLATISKVIAARMDETNNIPPASH
jgi:outer membrane protein TolC